MSEDHLNNKPWQLPSDIPAQGSLVATAYGPGGPVPLRGACGGGGGAALSGPLQVLGPHFSVGGSGGAGGSAGGAAHIQFTTVMDPQRLAHEQRLNTLAAKIWEYVAHGASLDSLPEPLSSWVTEMRALRVQAAILDKQEP